MSELDDLIAEQARDMAHSDYEPGEANVARLAEYAQNAGEVYHFTGRRQKNPECSIHGTSQLKWKPGGGWSCRPCSREYVRRWRARNPERNRELKRQEYLRVKQDPDRYAARLKYFRDRRKGVMA